MLACYQGRPYCISTMSIRPRHIESILRHAEVEEIQRGEGRFASDLADIMTPERITNSGVSIEFGADRAAFEATLSLLNVDTCRQRDDLLLASAVSADAMSESHVGTALTHLSEMRISEALDVLQTEHWAVQDSGKYKSIVRPSEQVSSRIVIANKLNNGSEENQIDVRYPGVAASVTYAYAPRVEYDYRELTTEGLDALVAEAEAGTRDRRRFVVRFAEIVNQRFVELHMPDRNYSIDVGMITRGSFLGGIGGVIGGHRFVAQSGRIKPANDDPDYEI